MFNCYIKNKSVVSFSLKIIKTKDSAIAIGVVDHSKQKNNRSSIGSSNAISYYGYPGYSESLGLKVKQEERGFR